MLAFAPTLPNMHSHCQKCNARLLINDEWHSGQCIECKQWADVLARVDDVIKLPIKPAPDDFAAIMAWIDAYTAMPDEPPTGVIPRPNRAS